LYAFVIDFFARRTVGWHVSSSLATDFVLDALEQVIYDRCGLETEGLVYHSDRGTQYVSMRYTDCFANAGIHPPSAAGDPYDNALAESASGFFEITVIRLLPPWPYLEASIRHCAHSVPRSLSSLRTVFVASRSCDRSSAGYCRQRGPRQLRRA
jgi:transposase InsO family protein